MSTGGVLGELVSLGVLTGGGKGVERHELAGLGDPLAVAAVSRGGLLLANVFVLGGSEAVRDVRVGAELGGSELCLERDREREVGMVWCEYIDAWIESEGGMEKRQR